MSLRAVSLRRLLPRPAMPTPPQMQHSRLLATAAGAAATRARLLVGCYTAGHEPLAYYTNHATQGARPGVPTAGWVFVLQSLWQGHSPQATRSLRRCSTAPSFHKWAVKPPRPRVATATGTPWWCGLS